MRTSRIEDTQEKSYYTKYNSCQYWIYCCNISNTRWRCFKISTFAALNQRRWRWL